MIPDQPSRLSRHEAVRAVLVQTVDASHIRGDRPSAGMAGRAVPRNRRSWTPIVVPGTVLALVVVGAIAVSALATRSSGRPDTGPAPAAPGPSVSAGPLDVVGPATCKSFDITVRYAATRSTGRGTSGLLRFRNRGPDCVFYGLPRVTLLEQGSGRTVGRPSGPVLSTEQLRVERAEEFPLPADAGTAVVQLQVTPSRSPASCRSTVVDRLRVELGLYGGTATVRLAEPFIVCASLPPTVTTTGFA